MLFNLAYIKKLFSESVFIQSQCFQYLFNWQMLRLFFLLRTALRTLFRDKIDGGQINCHSNGASRDSAIDHGTLFVLVRMEKVFL